MKPFAFLSLAVLMMATALSCTESPVYACDLFSGGRCTVRPGQAYDVPPPPRPLHTWTEFSHFLYFHAKITPGMRIKKSAIDGPIPQACHYRLSDPRQQLVAVEGELEGFRTDEDGIWCFDYLGTELLHFVRKNDIADEKIDMALFPLELELILPLKDSSLSVKRQILLHLSGWNPVQGDGEEPSRSL